MSRFRLSPMDSAKSQPLTLPRDIYTAISSQLDPANQLRFRQVNTVASSLNFDTQICFQNITIGEYATWLLDQQKLLREEISQRRTKMWKYYGGGFGPSIELRSANSGGGTIDFNMKNGDITTYMDNKKLITKQDIVNYLLSKKQQEIINVYENPDIAWDILENRKSCYVRAGLTRHELFIKIFADTYSYPTEYIDNYMRYILNILSPLGIRRFTKDISEPFQISFARSGQFWTVRMPNNFNANAFNIALKQWLLSLQPNDLKFESS